MSTTVSPPRPPAHAHPHVTAWSGPTVFVVLAAITQSVLGWSVLVAAPLAGVAAALVAAALYWHGDRGGREYDRETERLGTISRVFYLIVGRPPTDTELAALAHGQALTAPAHELAAARPVRDQALTAPAHELTAARPVRDQALAAPARELAAGRPVRASALSGGVWSLPVVGPSDARNGGAA